MLSDCISAFTGPLLSSSSRRSAISRPPHLGAAQKYGAATTRSWAPTNRANPAKRVQVAFRQVALEEVARNTRDTIGWRGLRHHFRAQSESRDPDPNCALKPRVRFARRDGQMTGSAAQIHQRWKRLKSNARTTTGELSTPYPCIPMRMSANPPECGRSGRRSDRAPVRRSAAIVEYLRVTHRRDVPTEGRARGRSRARSR